jgi:hypothetical protein
MTKKTVTLDDFFSAIEVISNYKSQLEEGISGNNSQNSRIINISKDVNPAAFKALSRYYKIEFDKSISRQDLVAMEVAYLEKINYELLLQHRGFGKIAEHKFKQLMYSHNVISNNDI